VVPTRRPLSPLKGAASAPVGYRLDLRRLFEKWCLKAHLSARCPSSSAFHPDWTLAELVRVENFTLLIYPAA
jgi:hypothetical protein